MNAIYKNGSADFVNLRALVILIDAEEQMLFRDERIRRWLGEDFGLVTCRYRSLKGEGEIENQGIQYAYYNTLLYVDKGLLLYQDSQALCQFRVSNLSSESVQPPLLLRAPQLPILHKTSNLLPSGCLGSPVPLKLESPFATRFFTQLIPLSQ